MNILLCNMEVFQVKQKHWTCYGKSELLLLKHDMKYFCCRNSCEGVVAGLFGTGQKQPTSFHPSIQQSHPLCNSFFLCLSLPPLTEERSACFHSLRGVVVEMRHWRHQPGNWGDPCQIFIKKTGLALTQRLIRRVENRVVILSGENFLGKTTGIKSIFVHSRSKAFQSVQESIC